MARNKLFIVAPILIAAAATGSVGCKPVPKPPTDTLTLAIQERAKNPAQPTAPASKRNSKTSKQSQVYVPLDSGAPVAKVGEISVSKAELDLLLVHSRGVAIFEQQIGLAAAQEYATRNGVTANEEDIDFEYGLALRRLSDPLAFTPVRDFERTDAQRLLDSILASRQMSREEFMLTVRRNALLRKVLSRELSITEEQLRAEFELVYGDRVLVRHIQLGNLADASRIKERLAAGEDFADLATRFSTNVTTSRRGGMLDAFSLRDEHIPQAMRQTAARLSEGEVSDVVRVGEWHHVLKLEQLIPAESRSFDSVRDQLQQRITVRTTDEGMRPLHEKLFNDAPVEIADPALFEAFRSAFPNKTNVSLTPPPTGS